jgi:hypothetical protein
MVVILLNNPVIGDALRSREIGQEPPRQVRESFQCRSGDRTALRVAL